MSTDILSRKINIKHFAIKFAERLEGDTTRRHDVVIVSVKSCFSANKTPKVVSVGCVGLWKHNGVLSRLMEQNKTKHPLALSRVEPRVTKFDKVPMF